MSHIQGTAEPRFEGLREQLNKFLDSDVELGASITVTIDGKEVVNLWGGHLDEAKTKPWQAETIVNVWSTTKTVTSLATLLCVERGLLDVDEKVSRYWPEFAANGKQDILVKHLMSHMSGLSGWQRNITVEEFADSAVSTPFLAQQAPLWPPGTASGYHSNTFGHLLGEVIARVTGKSLKQFVADELAMPLGADFQIGARESDWNRIADLVPPPVTALEMMAQLPEDSIPVRTFLNPRLPNARTAMTEVWRRGEIGATNGHSNSRGVARLLDVITNGGQANGVRLLSPKTIALIFEEQSRGLDLALPVPVRFGIGFGLTRTDDFATFVDDFLPQGRICYWGGWGGSVAIMDLDRKMTICYAMNKMSETIIGNEAVKAYVNHIYDVLGR